MCGIVGVWEKAGASVERSLLLRMTRTLKHRGPDDHGTVIFRPADGRRWRTSFSPSLDESDGAAGQGGLGHTRLSVIDLTRQARQPLTNRDGSLWITYNGEVYNYAALRDELIRLGHRFRSRGDTEVVLHAYEEWGSGCLSRLNGMFAFCVADLDRRELFLARDRLGIKPLYYFEDAHRFAFASEPKALLVHGGIPVRLDPAALCDYLALGYTPSPRSFFRGIGRISPGCFLVRRLEDVGRPGAAPARQEAYWDVRFGKADLPGTGEACQEELRQALSRAVRLRMMSDVPLGAFLSGGVDSSAIVSQMVGASPSPVRTFSIGFPEQEHSELPFARQVSERLGTDHREEVLGTDLVPLLPQVLRYYDEPLADTSILPTFALCGMARKHVTVCLSGDGADELFGGYAQHGTAARARRADRVPAWLRPLFAALRSRHTRPGSTVSGLAGGVFGPALPDCVGIEAVPAPKWAPGLVREDLLPSPDNSHSPYEALHRTYRSCPPRALPLDRVQSVDLKTYLPEDILTKVDRASMAFGLEVRVPFLDHHLVELVARMPPHMRVRAGTHKVALKAAFSRILPEEILTRPKQGFAVPEAPWLLQGHLEPIEQRLLRPDARIGEVLAQDRLPPMIHAFREGASYLGRVIWGLHILEEWMRSMDVYGGIRVRGA